MFYKKGAPVKTRSSVIFYLTAVASALTIAGCTVNSDDEDESLEMDGMEQAMRQEFLMTRDPELNYIPNERLRTAMTFLISARTTQIDNLSWQERGPNNIGGRSRAILIDKRDPTGNTVFAASVSGGIFKTTNFTSPSANWTVVDDQMANLAVTALVQDKNNLNTMYAATGEGWFNIDGVKGAGIFKTIDGGVTWTQLASTASIFDYVQDIVIDNNGNLYAALRNIFAASARGVQRSTNGGTTWTQVLGLPLTDHTYTTGRAADLEVATNGDLYATLGIFTRTMIFRSSFAANGANTGALGTWQEITPPHNALTCRAEIAVAPSNPQRLYVMMQDSLSDRVDSFYRSSDAGVTWSAFTAPTALNNGTNSQTWYNLISAVDSTNADLVYVGGHELSRSADGGATWTNISSAPAVHVDQHALAVFGSRLLVGNDGGIYYSSDATTGTPSFITKNNGFNVTQFYGCDFHPGDPNYFLAGAQDNNTQKFTSAGINSTTPVVGGDGGIPHIRQTDGQLQIAATTANNYFRSLDAGNTWTTLSSVNNNRGQFINPTDFDDAQNILYAGDDTAHYYCITNLNGSTPAGSQKRITQMGDRGVTAVKIDPFVSNTIWIGASVVDETQSSVPAVVIKITNANTTPVVTLTKTIAAGNGAYISSIDVDPANANNILVTLSNYGIPSVWESTDGGANFISLDQNGVNLPDMPIRWGLFAPAGAQLSGTTGGGIILGTELGVWTASTISGTTTSWIANNSGLPNVRTDMVKYRPANTSLVAATHGRGLYTTTLTGVVTGVSNNVITKNFIKYISADINQLLIVKGDLNVVKVQVQIYDAVGKLLYNQAHPYQNLTLPLSRWSKGTYVLKIQGNNKENFVGQFIKR